MNLDKPLIEQYALWLGKVASLDLGFSFSTREDISVLLGSDAHHPNDIGYKFKKMLKIFAKEFDVAQAVRK